MQSTVEIENKNWGELEEVGGWWHNWCCSEKEENASVVLSEFEKIIKVNSKKGVTTRNSSLTIVHGHYSKLTQWRWMKKKSYGVQINYVKYMMYK